MIKNNILYFLICLVFFVSSCKKGDDGPGAPNFSTGLQPAMVGVVHASAGNSALDIAIDGNKLGVKSFSYTDRIEYLNSSSGTRNLKVYTLNSFGTANAQPSFSKDFSFTIGKFYTVFIVDTASKMDAVSLRDSTRSVGKDSSMIRFANMSPDAPALDLYIKGNATPIAIGVNYKTAGNFFSVAAANNVIFEVKPNGQDVILGTSEATNLNQYNIYTIWCGGYVKGEKLSGTNIRIQSFIH